MAIGGYQLLPNTPLQRSHGTLDDGEPLANEIVRYQRTPLTNSWSSLYCERKPGILQIFLRVVCCVMRSSVLAAALLLSSVSASHQCMHKHQLMPQWQSRLCSFIFILAWLVDHRSPFFVVYLELEATVSSHPQFRLRSLILRQRAM